MRKIIMICAVALMAIVGTAQAQNNNRQRMSKEDMTKMAQKRAENLAKSLKLSDSQKEAYLKLVTEYLTREMEIRQSGEPKAKEKRDNKKTLTDAEAEEMIQKNFERERERLTLQVEYLQKLKTAGLTSSQLLTLFRDNRMNNIRNRNNNNNSSEGPGQGFGGPGGPGGGFGGPGGGF